MAVAAMRMSVFCAPRPGTDLPQGGMDIGYVLLGLLVEWQPEERLDVEIGEEREVLFGAGTEPSLFHGDHRGAEGADDCKLVDFRSDDRVEPVVRHDCLVHQVWRPRRWCCRRSATSAAVFGRKGGVLHDGDHLQRPDAAPAGCRAVVDGRRTQPAAALPR
jgi:hypothetical protein